MPFHRELPSEPFSGSQSAFVFTEYNCCPPKNSVDLGIYFWVTSPLMIVETSFTNNQLKEVLFT